MRRAAGAVLAFGLAAAFWAAAPLLAGSAPQGGTGAPQQDGGSGTGIADYTPGVVTSLTGTLGTPASSAIDLTWTWPSVSVGSLDQYDGAKIERSENGAAWATLVEDTASTTAAYTDTGLTAGGTYNYRAYARNGTIVGAVSNETGDIVTSALAPDVIFGTLLASWHDFSDLSSVAWSAGVTIGTLTDKSGNGHDLIVSDGGNAPDTGTITIQSTGGTLACGLFDDANTEFLTTDPPTSPITGAPSMIWVMFLSDSATVQQTLVSFADDSDDAHYFSLLPLGATAGDPLSWSVNDGAQTLTTTANGFTTSGTVNMVRVKEVAANDHRVQLNQGTEATSATSRTPTGVDKMSIGATNRNVQVGTYLSGRVCEVVVVSPSTAVTAQMITEIEQYLTEKWQFVLFLPFGWAGFGRRRRRRVEVIKCAV